MTVTLFLGLLAAFSVITGICTEGVKKLLDENKVSYSSHMLAFVIACVVGIGGTAVNYVMSGIPFDTANVICMVLMGLATSMGTMVGYDKVIQTVKQFGK